ncbi:MAG TPA: glycosyltransferase family 39 protein [Polyangiaceae bacterium]
MPDTDSLGGAPESERPVPSGSLGTPEPSVSPLRSAFAGLTRNAHDIAITVALALLCLTHRIQTLEPVNTGGDAATKWQFVREWFFKHDFAHAEWNHHMTRFGVLVPAYLSQLLLGHGIRAYYAAPLAACVVQVVFVYACGKRLSGRLAGVLGALLLIYTSLMATAGSQLLPDLFTGTYAIVMTYLYLRHADAQGKARTAWLIGSALCAFVGYLAKETMVFFYPGMAIAIWLAACNHGEREATPFKAKLKPLLVFFGVLLVGLALETLAYRVFTGYHSRASIVVASHIGNGDEGGRADTTFWKLFDRYLHIDKGWVLAFYVFLPCWLGLLGFAKNYRVRGLLSVVASFFFLLTFLVRSLNPLLLWQRFMSRYLDPTAPFVQLVTALFVALVVEQLWQERGSGRVSQQLGRLERYSATFLLVSCAALAASSYLDLKEEGSRALTQGRELTEISNDAYARNLPIVIRKSRIGGPAYARDVLAIYAIYIEPKALLRGGRLPSFEEAKRVSGSFTYLVRNPKAYSAAKLNHMLDAGCALEVRENTPTMSVSPAGSLPTSCDTELAN